MAQVAEVLRLQHEISRMQRASARVKALSVPDPLTPLFPDGGLRPGSIYALEQSMSLLIALMSAASQTGSWCAVVGMPTFSSEAASHAGVDLSRTALVPNPGDRWLSVISSIAEVFPIVAVKPQGKPRDGDLSRLAARLRDRGGVLLALGAWPHAEQTLRLERPEWDGIGDGHGILTRRIVTVRATGRRMSHPADVRVMLPGAHGHAVTEAPAAVGPSSRHVRPLHLVPDLEAVGS